MKTIKIILLGLIVVVLLAFAVGAYQYYRSHGSTSMVTNAANAPVIAGTIVALDSHAITIQKQDGSKTTFSTGDSTIVESVVVAGERGKSLSDLQSGTMVVVAASAQAPTSATKVSVMPPPPTPTMSAAGTPVVVVGTVQTIKSGQFTLNDISGGSVFVTKSASVQIFTKVLAGQTGKTDIATGDTVSISGITTKDGVTAQTIEILSSN
ncbi:MAG TPA: hypothetical protein VIY48_11320 [Candidatus Paceibacterota bacterium]